MSWSMRPRGEQRKVLLLVSKFDHCLADLLYRWRIGELPMDIVGIVSNHPRETYAHLDFGDIPFHHLPVTQARPSRSRRRRSGALVAGDAAPIWSCSRATCRSCRTICRPSCSGRCINIHHSFLPGFKGAKPYHQAHERGVKLIGATAHYVTARPRRGPDHRAGRRAHHATATRPTTWCARAATSSGACWRGRCLAPGGPRDPQRRQDRRLPRLSGS